MPLPSLRHSNAPEPPAPVFQSSHAGPPSPILPWESWLPKPHSFHMEAQSLWGEKLSFSTDLFLTVSSELLIQLTSNLIQKQNPKLFHNELSNRKFWSPFIVLIAVDWLNTFEHPWQIPDLNLGDLRQVKSLSIKGACLWISSLILFTFLTQYIPLVSLTISFLFKNFSFLYFFYQ